MNKEKVNVLMVGSDLTSNGGIASVSKTLYYASLDFNNINLSLYKTTFYKDRNKLCNILLFIKMLVIFAPYLVINKIDIVHFHSSSHYSFFKTIILFQVAKIMRKKTIIHLHASDFYEYFIDNKNKVKNYIFRNSNYVFVLCNDWKEKLELTYNLNNVIFMPNPIELRDSSIQIVKKKSNEFNILFVGFFIRTKGIIDLLNVAKQCINKNNNIKFTLAGKGPLSKSIENFIFENKLSNNIHLYGWANNEQKEDLYSNSDTFILPSYNEGMPISILEAMKYSLPIISTNIAGIPDEVENGENGFLFNPGDIIGFINAILLLESDKKLRQKMSDYNKIKIKQFSSDFVFKKLEEVYLIN